MWTHGASCWTHRLKCWTHGAVSWTHGISRKRPELTSIARYDLSVTNHTPSVAGSALRGEALLLSLAGTLTADGTDLLGTREEADPWLRAAGLLAADAVLTGS